MDSKMECMRSLIENDRQVEGCFTTYNTALERSALKKDRFLNGEPEPQKPPEPAAQQSNGSSAPGQDSLFADKLRQALQPAGPPQEG